MRETDPPELFSFLPPNLTTVRKSFCLGLPYPKMIQDWYSSIDGSAGFTKEAFERLKAMVIYLSI